MSTVLAGTPELEQMQYDYDVAATAVETATNAVQAGIKAVQRRIKADLAEAEAGNAGLGTALDEVPDAIQKLAVARGSAKVAAYHAPSVKLQGKAIVAAIKQIATWEKGLLKLQSEAQALDQGMTRAMDDQWKVVFAYHEQVNQAKAAALEVSELGSHMAAALSAAHRQAQARVAQRNADGLALYQADASSIKLKLLKDALARLAVPHDKALALQDDVTDKARAGRAKDMQTAQACRSAGEARLTALATLQKSILALKVEPVDLAKALKALGLGAAHKLALQKALDKPPAQREKAMDALAAAAQLATKGRAMLDLLTKARLI